MMYAIFNKSDSSLLSFTHSKLRLPSKSLHLEISTAEWRRVLEELDAPHCKAFLTGDKKSIEVRKVPPENTWVEVRRKRDGLLARSDFMVLPDFPGDVERAKVYRQELRDIPQKYKSPGTVKWPTLAK